VTEEKKGRAAKVAMAGDPDGFLPEQKAQAATGAEGKPLDEDAAVEKIEKLTTAEGQSDLKFGATPDQYGDGSDGFNAQPAQYGDGPDEKAFEKSDDSK
jgi:hypothetical protein